MSISFSHDMDVIERLKRRARVLESGAALLRAEIETLARHLEAPGGMVEARADGRVLDFGLQRLFTPGDLEAHAPVEAYRRYLDHFWFGWDHAATPQPDLRIWHGPSPLASDEAAPRVGLTIDLRARGGADWMLLELPLDWEQLESVSRLAVTALAEASHAVSPGVWLYANTMEKGRGVNTVMEHLPFSERPIVTSTEIPIQPAFYAEADRTSPPILHIHLGGLDGVRLQLYGLELVAVVDGADPIARPT